jgi:hypothetical protein
MLRRRVACLSLLVALLAADPSGGGRGPSDASPLFRLVLNDGTTLVSFGEFSRVGDRVVFSMPLGSPRGDRLQLVNLPASVVDWESTSRYTEATRYAQYVATRAEADFAVLTGQVAEALSEIALAEDPARRLQIAEDARRLVQRWPAEHFGYRSNDVREMDALLEGTVSELRTAAGVRGFGFSMVAVVEPPAMPLLPDPSASQALDQALLAARLSDIPAERLALLQAVIGIIDQSPALPRGWVKRTRAEAQASLDAEQRVERRYDALSKAALARAEAGASSGDVRAVEGAIATARALDQQYGEQRKEVISGLFAALRERLDAATRLRLARDRWAQRADAFRAYRAAIVDPLERLTKLRPRLEDVKDLAGPSLGSLPALIHVCERVQQQLVAIRPPDEMAAAHAALLSSAELGQQALRTRERATMAVDLKAAWDASAAAAGSLMMLAQARQQIKDISRPPESR